MASLKKQKEEYGALVLKNAGVAKTFGESSTTYKQLLKEMKKLSLYCLIQLATPPKSSKR